MQFPLQYPLTLRFKIVALAPQVAVTDANGHLIAYVKQKLLKLKESVTVFADEGQTRPLYQLDADRVIDFSARYHFADEQGLRFGAVQRQGMRSLWKAEYDVLDGDMKTLEIREENAWVKVADGLFQAIPIVGMLAGYVFHPAYLVTRPGGELVLRMQKQPAFFEGVYEIARHSELAADNERRALLSLIMLVLLERRRG